MSIPNNSGGFQKTIARFDPLQNSWTKLGSLNVARSGHKAIQIDNEFIVVGGLRTFGGGVVESPTESCKLNAQSMKCTTRQPTSTKFTIFPELMLML